MDEVGSSTLQTLTCRVPTVTNLFPIQTMWLILLTHLLLAYSVAAPVRALMLQIYRKPSFENPKLARYRESGLKAKQLTPYVWSVNELRGVSDGASEAVEKMRTRGL
jgi:hypothetical protein